VPNTAPGRLPVARDAQQADDREQYMDELTAQVALPPELISFMQKVEKVS